MLTQLEDGCIRELRHDFRHYYNCCYDLVEPDEAIDLIVMLPDGAAYVRKKNPARAWNAEKHNTADIVDALWEIRAVSVGIEADKAPHIIRPAQQVAREHKRTEARATKAKIENTKWRDA